MFRCPVGNVDRREVEEVLSRRVVHGVSELTRVKTDVLRQPLVSIGVFRLAVGLHRHFDHQLQRPDSVKIIHTEDDGEQLRRRVRFIAREDEVDLKVGGKLALSVGDPC